MQSAFFYINSIIHRVFEPEISEYRAVQYQVNIQDRKEFQFKVFIFPASKRKSLFSWIKWFKPHFLKPDFK